jgi:Rieske Fe-S protein
MNSTKLQRMDRRSWMRSIVAMVGALGTAVGLERFLSPEGRVGSRTFRVGRVDDVLADGARKTIQLEGKSILLSRRGEQVIAFDLTCTHAGCPLAYNAKGGRITCACHGGAFDLDGKPVAGPPTIPLTRLECAIDNGDLLVHISGTQS